MHSLEKKINRIIHAKQLVVSDDVVLVGVSAGPDSTALLLALSCLQQALGVSLFAVYVDHGLRPEETPAERAFLQKLCGELDIHLTIECVDVEREKTAQKESAEQAARRLRYGVFSKVAQECGADKVAVGHTADDQAEEVLLRLLRGTARSGLSGMKLMRDGYLIRPLLPVAKSEIYTYLQERDQPFMEDSSNHASIYLRNQVRLEVLPFLRRYNPSVDNSLRNLALILQDEEDLLARQTDVEWDAIVEASLDQKGLPVVAWKCLAFTSLHVALQRRVAEKMFIVMQSQPSSDKIKQLLYLIEHGQGGGQLHFGHGLRALKEKGLMRFWYPQGREKRKGDLV